MCSCYKQCRPHTVIYVELTDNQRTCAPRLNPPDQCHGKDNPYEPYLLTLPLSNLVPSWKSHFALRNLHAASINDIWIPTYTKC